MKRMALIIAVVLILLSPLALASEQMHNTLSEQEQKDGWVLLFDGTTTEGWTGTRTEGFPSVGWTVENGELIVLPAPGDGNRS